MEVQSQGAGAPAAAAPDLDPERQRALYRAMRRARAVDARLRTLGEATEVGFLPSCAGREAALAGALAALDDGDWLFPTVHDWPLALQRGMPVATFVHRVFGDASDPLLGRDMPGGLSAKALRVASVSAPAATHLPHAVGLAWAAARRGEDLVAAALFDAREVDAADFHTGLNFGGVMKAPTLFLCLVEAGGEGAAEHAVAYGLPHAVCDGASVSAVYRAVRAARERAAAGEGPTVIDLTLGADPVTSLREALERAGHWSAEDERALLDEVERELAEAVDAARRVGAPSLRSLFDDVFEGLPPHLLAQRSSALDR